MQYGKYADYVEMEDTSFDLYEKFKPLDNEKQNEILIQIDGNTFHQQDFGYIQQLSEIIQDSGEDNFHGEIRKFIIDIIRNEYIRERS